MYINTFINNIKDINVKDIKFISDLPVFYYYNN
jgi:hypothetical protein